MEMVSRETAISIGVGRYFTGVPCKNGHLSQRRTSDRVCISCEREKEKRHTSTDKGKAAFKRKNNETPASRARKTRYAQSEKGRGARLRFNHSEKYKVYRKNFDATEKGRACNRRQQHNRRARIGNVTIVPYGYEDLLNRFAVFDNRCVYCGSENNITEDHFIPIARGGENKIENIVPACSTCNKRKNAQDPYGWYRKQSFFSKEKLEKIQQRL